MGASQCCAGKDEGSVSGVDGATADLSDKLVDQRPTVPEKDSAAAREKKTKDAAKKKKADKAAKEKKAKEDARKAAEEAERRKKEKEAKENQLRMARLGDLGKPGAKLQVELETGWSDVGDDYFKQVCDNVAAGGTKFPIQARGAMYFIDWSDNHSMSQKNIRSGKTHKLRVQ